MGLHSIMYWGFLYLPATVVVSYFLNYDNMESIYHSFVIFNVSWQTIGFFLIAMCPAYFTNRMCYVDISWSFGIALMGILAFFTGSGFFWRRAMVSAEYLVMGGKMTASALVYFAFGKMEKESPKYLFLRFRWRQRGESMRLSMQLEIFVQALCNMAYFGIPALLQANDPTQGISELELAGHAMWIFGWIFEEVADSQKANFMNACYEKKIRNVCNVGLWRYCRAPNLFGQWVMWLGLVCASLNTLLTNPNRDPSTIQLVFAFCLIMTTYLTYWFLTDYIGAFPAEHFQIIKKPQYKTYIKHTNMFIPGFPSPLIDNLNDFEE